MSRQNGVPNMKLIQSELSGIKIKIPEIPNTKIVACCESMVRFGISLSKVKELDICLQFPKEYPNSLILMEAKSRTLPEKFLDSIPLAFEKEKERFVGKAQCILALRFVLDFLEANTLCYCVQEIVNLKSLMDLSGTASKDDTKKASYFKVRQKQSCVAICVVVENYFLESKIEMPDDYPFTQVKIEIKDSNFPAPLLRYFNAQAREIARQCVEPPLLRRKKDGKPIPRPANFQPKASLEPVGRFLIQHCKQYPLDVCGLCKKRCFPANPKDLPSEEESPTSIVRIYCDHIYHFGCMDNYMNTPPFEGKECTTCKATIYHNNWKESEKTREERWAHKEAKQRELEEVEDFLK